MDRYRLILAIGARTIMRGWWPDLPTAGRKYLLRIGERGGVSGARVPLVDEAAHGRALKS
ncbi:hypothetical protein ABWJ92_32495 [Streptomyces sp. NPDC000609]|uniref:hypothetical protein n=1 Tax=Streptomyces sp. NPDC000609 TaxID=3160957 RepID=UPI00339B79A1